MNNHSNDFGSTGKPAAADNDSAPRAERISKSKRTLLKAGWVVPVIGVVSLPSGSTNLSCDPNVC